MLQTIDLFPETQSHPASHPDSVQFGCVVLGAAKLPSCQLAEAKRMPVTAIDPWEDAFSLWLASRPSRHTRRAYRSVVILEAGGIMGRIVFVR
jgi:hypothetical protein